MSKLLNLKGAKLLTKKEQKSINGGLACAPEPPYCRHGQICVDGWCQWP